MRIQRKAPLILTILETSNGQPGRLQAAFERLEPCAGKLACTVLRGLGGGNTILATRQKAKRRYAQVGRKSLHLYLNCWRTWVHAGLPFEVQSVVTVAASMAEKVTAFGRHRTHRE